VTALELRPSDLLGAASAWAATHPREAPDALTAVYAAASVGPSDPRRSAAERVLVAALGSAYPDGPLLDRLAQLRAAEGPRAVADALARAGRKLEARESRQAVAATPARSADRSEPPRRMPPPRRPT
jgi:hypothetical protein